MSENERSRREAFTESTEDSPKPAGHSIHDVGERSQQDNDAAPVRRTQRDASDTREDETVTRTRRGNGDVRSRSDQSGNLSETGAGSSNPAPTGPARRPGPGTLPIGCARSAGSLLLIGIGAVVAIGRIVGR